MRADDRRRDSVRKLRGGGVRARLIVAVAVLAAGCSSSAKQAADTTSPTRSSEPTSSVGSAPEPRSTVDATTLDTTAATTTGATTASTGGGTTQVATTETTSATVPASPDAPLFSGLAPDGSVTVDVARQAFADVFGPIGDTQPSPSGHPVSFDATSVLRWIEGVSAELTDEERATVQRVLDVLEDPEDDSEGTEEAEGTGHSIRPERRHDPLARGGGAAAAPAPEDDVCVRLTPGQPVPAGTDEDLRQLAELTLAADKYFQDHLGRGAVGNIRVCIKPTGSIPAPVMRPRPPRKDPLGRIDHCVASYPESSLDSADVPFFVSLLTYHCFLATAPADPTVATWKQLTRKWYISGAMMWATASAAEVLGNGTSSSILAPLWDAYLASPARPLNERQHDAIGFFAQRAAVADSLWDHLDDVVTSEDSIEAYDAASGDREVESVWPSGYARDENRGAAWVITGPGITSTEYKPGKVTIANGESVTVESVAYGGALEAVTATADLVSFEPSAATAARVSDGALDIEKISGVRCIRDDECACPDSDDQPPDPLGSEFLLGVTQGTVVGDLTMRGISLEEYCKDKGKKNWSFAYLRNGAAVPLIAGYTCQGLFSTWHVIFFPYGGPLLERIYDLEFTDATPMVHHDLVYDLPPDGLSSAVHLEYRLDYLIDTSSSPPMLRISGQQHETPVGDTEHVFDFHLGTENSEPLANTTLLELLNGQGTDHPFVAQSIADCG